MLHNSNTLGFNPANSRLPEIARRSIRAIGNAAAQQLVNAINVNGVPSLLYPRLQAGRKCTCQQVNSSVLTADGTLTEHQINGLVSITTPLSHDDNRVFTYGLPNDPIALLDDPQTATPTFSRFADTACGVCFGTGFVGGFTLYNGFRIVAVPDDFDFDTGYTDQQSMPNLGVIPAQGTATTVITLPRGVQRVIARRVLNSTDDLSASIKLSLSTQDTLASTGKPVEVVITNVTDEDVMFTHLEIAALQTANLMKVDFPKLDKNPRVALYDDIGGQSIIIPPSVSGLPPLSIITENLWGAAWMLTEVNTVEDNSGFQHWYETSGRLIQASETYDALPHYSRVRRKLIVPRAQQLI